MFAEPFNVFMDGNLVFMQIKWDTEVRVILGEHMKILPSLGNQAENPGLYSQGLFLWVSNYEAEQ